VSQIIPVCIFTAFSSVDLHLIIADIVQDSTFKYSIPAFQVPAYSILMIVFPVTYATEQCNQVNKIQSTTTPIYKSFPFSMLSIKILYVFVKYSRFTPAHPVLIVKWDGSVGIVTTLQNKWPRTQGSLPRKNK